MSGNDRSFSIPSWASTRVPEWVRGDGPTAAPRYPPLLEADEWKPIIREGLSRFFDRSRSSARKVLIMVEDASRPSDTAPVIAAIADQLHDFIPAAASMEILIAGGAHRGMEKENASKVPRDFPGIVRTHDCRTAGPSGEVDGIPVFLDQAVINADLRIAVGTVNLHPKAGFSGGAKILTPGCAGLPTIFGLHNLAEGQSGQFDTAIRRFAHDVLARFPVDFAVQLLSDDSGRVLRIFSGELRDAWQKAAETLLSWVTLPAPAGHPLCVADCSPFCQNLMGIFKALSTVVQATPADGRILLLTRSPQGLGHHLWRLDNEIINRERKVWEEKLEKRVIQVITEAPMNAERWDTVFPPQIRPFESASNFGGNKGTDRLALVAAPLIRIEPK